MVGAGQVPRFVTVSPRTALIATKEVLALYHSRTSFWLLGSPSPGGARCWSVQGCREALGRRPDMIVVDNLRVVQMMLTGLLSKPCFAFAVRSSLYNRQHANIVCYWGPSMNQAKIRYNDHENLKRKYVVVLGLSSCHCCWLNLVLKGSWLLLRSDGRHVRHV